MYVLWFQHQAIIAGVTSSDSSLQTDDVTVYRWKCARTLAMSGSELPPCGGCGRNDCLTKFTHFPCSLISVDGRRSECGVTMLRKASTIRVEWCSVRRSSLPTRCCRAARCTSAVCARLPRPVDQVSSLCCDVTSA